MRFPPGSNWISTLAIVAIIALAAAFGTVPQFRTQVIGIGGAPSQAQQGAGPSAAGLPTSTAGSTNNGPQSTGVASRDPIQAPSGLQCAQGKNGGSTDRGVDAGHIYLASTVAETGVGAAFLGEARYGMLAVVSQVNRQGGICGRQLDLTVVDDGWSAQTGLNDIRNFINENYFALAVVPSSEGLNAAARAPWGSGDIDSAPDPVTGTKGIPVVGTDGMLISQYEDPWIWPVATSTISTAHLAVKSAYDAGARTFGIVWDKTYRFGTEGEAAFRGAISRLAGAKLSSDVGIEAGQQDYSSQVNQFNQGCHPCDVTFMMLEPDTALAWIKSDQSSGHYVFGSKRTEGPQPLFVSSFGQGCGQLCNNMWLWSGFEAPYPPFDSDAPVSGYVNAIRSVSASADTANQFTEGAYLGMNLLVDALRAISPYVTRARLKAQLDSMTFRNGLTKDLAWQSGNHFADTSMLGFTIQYSGGFNGFQYQQTGWLRDPWSGLDHSSS